MTHTYEHGRVKLQAKVNDYDQPIKFIWSGREFSVETIVETWEISTDWWESTGAIKRRYHALIADHPLAGGYLLVIYEDLIGGEWWLAKIYD